MKEQGRQNRAYQNGRCVPNLWILLSTEYCFITKADLYLCMAPNAAYNFGSQFLVIMTIFERQFTRHSHKTKEINFSPIKAVPVYPELRLDGRSLSLGLHFKPHFLQKAFKPMKILSFPKLRTVSSGHMPISAECAVLNTIQKTLTEQHLVKPLSWQLAG